MKSPLGDLFFCSFHGVLSALFKFQVLAFIAVSSLLMFPLYFLFVTTAAFLSPPSDPFICVLEREMLILLLSCISWA